MELPGLGRVILWKCCGKRGRRALLCLRRAGTGLLWIA
jgi:hypothetical protein